MQSASASAAHLKRVAEGRCEFVAPRGQVSAAAEALACVCSGTRPYAGGYLLKLPTPYQSKVSDGDGGKVHKHLCAHSAKGER